MINDLCPAWRSLLISKKDISDSELGMILQSSTNLELLRVWGWPEITFEGLAAIQGERLKVKYLEVTECSQLTDKGLALIAEKFPIVEDLILGPFCFATTEGFQHIVNRWTSLVSLELDMSDVSREQIEILLKRCPKLIALQVEHARTLRKEGLEDFFYFLSEKYPHLAICFH